MNCRLLVSLGLVTLVLMMTLVEARPGRGRGGRGRGGRGRGGRHHPPGPSSRALDQLLSQACLVNSAEGEITRACATGQTCTLGPLKFNVNSTDYESYYCTDFKGPPIFPDLPREQRKQLHGLCEVEVAGAAVFKWNCRGSDSCQYGPRDVTFQGQEAQGRFCRPGKEEKRNIKLNDMLEKACQVSSTETGTTNKDCPENEQCNQGPLNFQVNGTDFESFYCSGFKGRPVFSDEEERDELKGACRVELEGTGVTVFTWNCRDEDSCTHGPREVTYDETDAQAYYCHEQRRRGGRRDSSEEEEEEEGEGEGVGEDERELAGEAEQGGEGTEGSRRRGSDRQGQQTGGRGQGRRGGRGQGRRGGRGRQE